MDFFEAQDNARRKTKTLVALFIVAVFAMGGLIYCGTTFALISQVDPHLPWFSGERFFWVMGPVALFVFTCSMWKMGSLKEGGSSIALMLGAVKVPANPDDPKLQQYRHVVEEMAIASGIRIPEIYVQPDEHSINAFAAGYALQDAVVAVSQGCLDQLDRDELQGVVAHEFSHILNGDMRINTRLIGVLFGLLAVAVVGRFFLRGFAYSGGSRSRRNSKGGGGVIVIIAIVVMIVGYVGVFFGRLIQSAISRQREFLADAAAVQFTRNPGGIANALRKINLVKNGSRINHPDAIEAGHLFFSNAFSRPFASAFATHPPLADRIDAIDPRGDTVKKLTVKKRDETSKQTRRRTASDLVSGLGSLDEDSVAQAEAAIGSLPAHLSQMAREPLSASAILLASIGHGDRVSEYQRLTPDQQNSAFEIALSAIKELTPQKLEVELATLRQLAQADRVVDFNEHCLLMAIERNIHQFHTNSDVGKRPFQAIRPEVETVLSAIALAGASSDADAETSFAAGAVAFNRFGAQLRANFEAARHPGALNAALTKASEGIPVARRTLLQAAVKAVAHDETLTREETQYLRSLCAALDCPAPAL